MGIAVGIVYVFFHALFFLAHADEPVPPPSETTTRAVVKTKANIARAQTCSKKFLALKDCHLHIGDFHLHVWHDKLILQGPIERKMIALPLFGDDVRWESAEMISKNRRHFMQMVMWSPPQGQGEVESAVFYVFEVGIGRIDLKLDKIIQKRKKRADGKIYFDRKLPIEIFVKSGKVMWKVGKESGEL